MDNPLKYEDIGICAKCKDGTPHHDSQNINYVVIAQPQITIPLVKNVGVVGIEPGTNIAEYSF